MPYRCSSRPSAKPEGPPPAMAIRGRKIGILRVGGRVRGRAWLFLKEREWWLVNKEFRAEG